VLIDPVPNKYQPMAPYIIVKDAAKAISFYTRAFAATEIFSLKDPSGKIAHAELELAGARLMLADEHPDFGALSPISVGGTPVSIHLYVADVDKLVERAVAGGATLLRPTTDEFFGDRAALLVDPFGHRWHLATRIENVSHAEMQSRMDKAYAT
jgi:PhnB protein